MSIAPSALAAALFTPVQQRVLGLLFGQPNRRFQSTEVIRLAHSGTGAVHRVLTRLADAGLVTVTTAGRQKYYQANATSPVFAELTGLVRKTVGLVGPLRQSLEPLLDQIHAAFVFGSVASGADDVESDVDLMIIGEDLDYATVFEVVQQAEAALDRAVNPTIMSPESWEEKSRRSSFVSRVIDGPRVWVIGNEDELAATR